MVLITPRSATDRLLGSHVQPWSISLCWFQKLHPRDLREAIRIRGDGARRLALVGQVGKRGRRVCSMIQDDKWPTNRVSL
jgi:hypothetical protein